MKILLVHDIPPFKQNGVSVSLGILEKELSKTGSEVRVLTLSEDSKSHKEGNVYYLASVPALIYPGLRLRTKKHHEYVDELIEWNPDIIHTNCEFSTFRIAELIIKKCKKKPVLVHTLHTDYKYYIGLLGKIGVVRDKVLPEFLDTRFKKVDNLIVPTKKMDAYVRVDEFRHNDTYKVSIIPTGIDFSELIAQEEYSAKDARCELNVPQDAKIILFLGRISVEKNLEELVDDFAGYCKTHENVYLLTVGDGPYKETLIKKVKHLGLSDKVIIHDGVEHKEIRKYYDAADVFASASVSETQGLTFYEALFCGVPVLAKDRKCLEDAIIEGENGAFFDDEESFCTALDSIIDLKSSGGSGAPKISDSFKSEFFAKSVEALYEQALRDKNS